MGKMQYVFNKKAILYHLFNHLYQRRIMFRFPDLARYFF